MRLNLGGGGLSPLSIFHSAQEISHLRKFKNPHPLPPHQKVEAPDDLNSHALSAPHMRHRLHGLRRADSFQQIASNHLHTPAPNHAMNTKASTAMPQRPNAAATSALSETSCSLKPLGGVWPKKVSPDRSLSQVSGSAVISNGRGS